MVVITYLPEKIVLFFRMGRHPLFVRCQPIEKNTGIGTKKSVYLFIGLKTRMYFFLPDLSVSIH